MLLLLEVVLAVGALFLFLNLPLLVRQSCGSHDRSNAKAKKLLDSVTPEICWTEPDHVVAGVLGVGVA